KKMFRGVPVDLNQVKICENSPDETVRSRSVTKVLPHRAATGRRRPPERAASRRVTVVPNLFAEEGRVRRFDTSDQSSISRFFAEDSASSALICGDTETVLSRLPSGIFQSCVTSPPYWYATTVFRDRSVWRIRFSPISTIWRK